MALTVMYGRGSGVGVPIGVLRSKNSTCPGLSDASPDVTTTQCRLQSAVCPLTISLHCADGSLAISAETVSALGPSSLVQATEVVGDPPGGLHPHPAAARLRESTAMSREGRMAPELTGAPARVAARPKDVAGSDYPAASCFFPYTRSINDVSPWASTRTVLPSRRMNTSASVPVSPPAVTSVRATTVSSSATSLFNFTVKPF